MALAWPALALPALAWSAQGQKPKFREIKVVRKIASFAELE